MTLTALTLMAVSLPAVRDALSDANISNAAAATLAINTPTSAGCPSGLVCTAIPAQPTGCPSGYTCALAPVVITAPVVGYVAKTGTQFQVGVAINDSVIASKGVSVRLSFSCPADISSVLDATHDACVSYYGGMAKWSNTSYVFIVSFLNKTLSPKSVGVTAEVLDVNGQVVATQKGTITVPVR